MITILILIVKIIGIVLLCLLGIILLLISLVLFVPIRYRAIASKAEGISARAKVTWFLHFVSVTAFYEDDFNLIVKILGIPFYNAKTMEAKAVKKEARKSEKEKKKAFKKIGKSSETNRADNTASIKESDHALETDLRFAVEANVIDKDEKIVSNGKIEPKPITEKAEFERKLTLWVKIKRFAAMLYRKYKAFLEKVRNIKYTIKGIYDRIKKVIADIRYYIDVIQSEACKKAFSLCEKQLLIIWKHVKPKKYQLYLHIGMEDPSTLGTILAYYGMLYPVFTNHFILQPDFEHIILEGSAFIKGKITIVVFIKVAWIVFFDKNLRRLLALFKKEEL